MEVSVFRVVTSCNLDVNWRFGGIVVRYLEAIPTEA